MKPISECTVLELGTMVAAPFAGHLLSQLGARVVKVEPPTGDTTRAMVRGGPSGTFITYSRGKRSIAIDLAAPDARPVFERLLRAADVLVHNLSPAAARKLRLTGADCHAVHPGLVYCHITGYGEGPLENEIASNPIIEAATGVMFANRVDGRPTRLGPSYHDQFAGAYAVIGILAALARGGNTGAGRCVNVGLYETGLHVAARELVGAQLKGFLSGKPPPDVSAEFTLPGYGAYESADGRWMYLTMLSDAHWAKFCAALLRDASPDPELATARVRKKRRHEVEELVSAAVRAHGFDDAAARLRAVGFGYTEVLPNGRVLDEPQARHDKKLESVPFGGFDFLAPNFPLQAEDEEGGQHLPPPLLGEHTREVLQSVGYSAEDCAALIGSGVVGVPRPVDSLWARSK